MEVLEARRCSSSFRWTLETNVSVLLKVVPTRSARVIADEVPHSNSIAHVLTENEMLSDFALPATRDLSL